MLIKSGPSLYERERDSHTETFIKPLPGGLIRRGTETMTARMYTSLAARRKLTALFRFAPVADIYVHWPAACEHHTMLPLAEWNGADAWSILYPEWLYLGPFMHTHRVTWDFSTIMPMWRCVLKGCDHHGAGEYTQDTIAMSNGLVYYRCTRCGNIQGFPAISGGVPQTYYVDSVNGNDTTGAGTSGNPWATYTKAHDVPMVAGDTVLGRNGNYPERFGDVGGGYNASTAWQDGTSFANAVTIGADTGHTPVFNPTPEPVGGIHWARGSTKQYQIYSGITCDRNVSTPSPSSAGPAWRFDSTGTTGTFVANASHHMRMLNCEGKNLNADTALVSYRASHHCEVIGGVYHTATGTGLGAGTHAVYVQGADHLTDGIEAYQLSGYGVQCYNAGSGEFATDRSCIRNNEVHNYAGSGFNGGTGFRIGDGSTLLCYNNLVYVCSGTWKPFDYCIALRDCSSAQIFNNTVADNSIGGIAAVNSGVNGAVFRNNISVGNSGSNFSNSGTSTDLSGTTNSWQIAGYVNGFGAGTNNYQLTSSSSGVNAGTDKSATMNSGTFPLTPAVAIDGTSRPQESFWDLGAYEYMPPPTGPEPPTNQSGSPRGSKLFQLKGYRGYR